jgi:hypothetical protein
VYVGNARKPSMIKDETHHHLEDYPVNEVGANEPRPARRNAAFTR